MNPISRRYYTAFTPRVFRRGDFTVCANTRVPYDYHLRSGLIDTVGKALCCAIVDWNIDFPLDLWDTPAPVAEHWCPICLRGAGGVEVLHEQDRKWREHSKAGKVIDIAALEKMLGVKLDKAAAAELALLAEMSQDDEQD